MKKLGFLILSFILIQISAIGFEASPDFNEAIESYRNGNYTSALSKLNEILPTNANNPYFYYYLAITNVKLGQHTTAQEYYGKVLELTTDTELKTLAQNGIQKLTQSVSSPAQIMTEDSFNNPKETVKTLTQETPFQPTTPQTLDEDIALITSILVADQETLSEKQMELVTKILSELGVDTSNSTSIHTMINLLHRMARKNNNNSNNNLLANSSNLPDDSHQFNNMMSAMFGNTGTMGGNNNPNNPLPYMMQLLNNKDAKDLDKSTLMNMMMQSMMGDMMSGFDSTNKNND